MIVRSTCRSRLSAALFATLMTVATATALSASAAEPPTAAWERWNEKTLTVARDGRPVILLIGSEISTPARTLAASLRADGFHRIFLDEFDYPRVSAAYRAFAVATGAQASVPLAVVTTPALEPVVALDGDNRASLEEELAVTLQRWRDDREALVSPAAIAVRRFRLNSAPLVHDDALAERASRLHDDLLSGDETRRVAAVTSLKKFAASALFDQLGGGFYRAARDSEMRVPSFERALADQAAMISLYLDAYGLTREPRFAEVARMTANAMVRDFADRKSGVFYNGLQSVSLVPRGGPALVEGGAYVWEASEIHHLLGESDASLFFQHYGVRAEGNVPPQLDRSGDLAGRNVLFLALDPENAEVVQRLAAARAKLLDVRLNRPPAPLDARVFAGPNAAAISALARAALVLKDTQFAPSAERALRALLATHFDAKQRILYRARGAASIAATSDDFTLVTNALLEVYALTFDPLFLERAIELQKRHDDLFWDSEANRYDAERGVPAAVAGLAAAPDVTRISAANLALVGDFLNAPSLLARAEVVGGKPVQRRNQIVIRGALAAETTQALIDAVAAQRGEAPVIVLRTDRERTRLVALLPYLKEFADCPFADANPKRCPSFGAVCIDGSCGAPTVEPDRLRASAAMSAGAWPTGHEETQGSSR
jgi:uncharacterized protein YyaL (SSP411 family)